MSAVSRKLVEGRSGNLFIVEGSPGGGYTLLHVQTSVVGRYQRSWQAVRRAVDGIDSDPADGAEFAVSFSRRGQRSRGGMPVPPPASPLRDITSTTVAPVAVCVGV